LLEAHTEAEEEKEMENGKRAQKGEVAGGWEGKGERKKRR
jgi:hypothetical protein